MKIQLNDSPGRSLLPWISGAKQSGNERFAVIDSARVFRKIAFLGKAFRPANMPAFIAIKAITWLFVPTTKLGAHIARHDRRIIFDPATQRFVTLCLQTHKSATNKNIRRHEW